MKDEVRNKYLSQISSPRSKHRPARSIPPGMDEPLYTVEIFYDDIAIVSYYSVYALVIPISCLIGNQPGAFFKPGLNQ